MGNIIMHLRPTLRRTHAKVIPLIYGFTAASQFDCVSSGSTFPAIDQQQRAHASAAELAKEVQASGYVTAIAHSVSRFCLVLVAFPVAHPEVETERTGLVVVFGVALWPRLRWPESLPSQAVEALVATVSSLFNSNSLISSAELMTQLLQTDRTAAPFAQLERQTTAQSGYFSFLARRCKAQHLVFTQSSSPTEPALLLSRMAVSQYRKRGKSQVARILPADSVFEWPVKGSIAQCFRMGEMVYLCERARLPDKKL